MHKAVVNVTTSTSQGGTVPSGFKPASEPYLYPTAISSLLRTTVWPSHSYPPLQSGLLKVCRRGYPLKVETSCGHDLAPNPPIFPSTPKIDWRICFMVYSTSPTLLCLGFHADIIL